MNEKLRTNLIFVDCEAWGPCPAMGQLTEFGAVTFPDMQGFHGILCGKERGSRPYDGKMLMMFRDFEGWLRSMLHGQPVFVSDNPAYDWQWINDAFHRQLGRNPFGHSARRISDFYAGLRGDFRKTQEWKRLRITRHDHNPVNDARGNAEAFQRILAGER